MWRPRFASLPPLLLIVALGGCGDPRRPGDCEQGRGDCAPEETAPLRLQAGLDSGPQSTLLSTDFPRALIVRVVDGVGAGVAGVPVVFTPPTAGASATFGGSHSAGTLTARVETDAAGEARAYPFANGAEGTYEVEARAEGVEGAVRYTLSNVRGVPSRLVLVEGREEAQEPEIGRDFFTPAVRVLDAQGRAVAHVLVRFQAPAPTVPESPGLHYAGSRVDVVQGNEHGYASAPTFATPNTVAGAYVLRASVDGTSVSLDIPMRNRPSIPAELTHTSAQPLEARPGSAFPPATFVVRDAHGNRVPDAPLRLTVLSGESSSAGASFSGGAREVELRTGDDGGFSLPSLTANAAEGTFPLRAEVSRGALVVELPLRNTLSAPALAASSTGAAP